VITKFLQVFTMFSSSRLLKRVSEGFPSKRCFSGSLSPRRCFSSGSLPLLGIVGYRGMVGSILMDRMVEENDLSHFQPVLFSTSQAGSPGPDLCGGRAIENANSIDSLKSMDYIISCQGGDYTKEVHPKLRAEGWNGYWIDAASNLRMDESAVLVLDPVNRAVIEQGVSAGKKDFIGANCTVSLMLMATHGLYSQGWVDWISSATYQAASGAGAQNMKELLEQMGHIYDVASEVGLQSNIIDIDRKLTDCLREQDFPKKHFNAPLAASLLPFIDRLVSSGQSREEWKAQAESNKILATSKDIPVDGNCVRVGALRCHSQSLTIKLNKAVDLLEIEDVLKNQNKWVSFVPNNKDETIQNLTPTKVTGTLKIAVGRVRKLSMGDDYLSMFTVGDQLLWGAAEPLRRILRILIGKEDAEL